MANDDVVWVPILPSLRGFASELSRGTREAGESAGKDAGRAIASGIASAQRDVDKATTKLASAQDKVADAAGKTRVAEAKLEELRNKGNATALQLATAEERLESAKRGEERATGTLTTAQRDLDASNKRLQESTDAATASVDELGESSLLTGENLKKFGAAAAAGAAAAGAALLKMGSDWKEIENTIRTGTGASGSDLDALVESAKNVGTTVPVEFSAAADAITALNTHTAATGESLEHLSAQVLDASRMLGEDGAANADAFGRALVQWGMSADEGAASLDGVFVATQKYGVGLGDLTTNLNKYGSVMQNAGFTMEESSVLFGNLHQSGLSVSRIMPGLNAAFRGWASEGLNVQDTLADMVGQIENAEDSSKALSIATDAFGAEGAQRLTTAIRGGTFVLEDFGAALGDTDGAIANNSEQTRTMTDSWLALKNDALAELEPIATRVFDVINQGVGWIADNGVPAVKEFATWIGDNRQLLQDLGIAVGVASAALLTMSIHTKVMAAGGFLKFVAGAVTSTNTWAVAQRILNAVMRANPIGIVITALSALVGGLVIAYRNSETFRNIVQAAWRGIQDAVKYAWENVIRPAWDGMKAGLGALGDFFSWVWNDVIKVAWDGLGAGISWVWEHVVSPVFESLKTGVDLVGQGFDAAVGFIGQVWDRIKAIAAAPVKFVIESVYNNGIRSAWNKVAGWLGLDELEEYKPSWLGAYAGGGVLPGYSPGVDNMRFVSTDGSAAIDLGGGESILRPEVAAAVGPGWVEGVNAAARKGSGAVRQYLGGFAGGGIIDSIVSIARENFPGLSVTSTLRNTNDLHGAGKAVDLSNQSAGGPSTSLMQSATRFFYENYGPRLAELIHWPLNGWQNLKEGRPLNFGEPTNSQHTDHLHVAAHEPLGESGGFGDWAAGVWGKVTGWLRERVAGVFDTIMDPIGDAIPSFGDSAMGQLPKSAFDAFRGNVRDWLLGKADENEGAGGSVAPGSGPVRDQVREAMAAYGWDTGNEWAAVDWIIGKESSWDPLARNPESGAFGLAQFLGSTKDQYLPDENPNPRVQGDAMARYIRDRYGTPLEARAFWEQNGWYDDGGLATGRGVMMKDILDPERVLDPAQTRAFEKLVPHLVDLAGGVMDIPAFQAAANAILPGAGVALDAAAGAADAVGGFMESDAALGYADFMTQLPGQIGEEMGRDTLDFFGLGGVSDLVFADPAAASTAPEPAVEVTTTEPVEESSPGRDGPLVWIENLITNNPEEAAEAMRREAVRLVRSDALIGGRG